MEREFACYFCTSLYIVPVTVWANINTMRLVVQRIRSASVELKSTRETVSSVGQGLLVLWGLSRDDTWEDAEYCIKKLLGLRFWDDPQDSSKTWSHSVKDLNYELLIVSQFTLLGRLKKGTKPDFHEAMSREASRVMFDSIVEALRTRYSPEKVKTGSFGNETIVRLENDGPSTLVIESAKATK